MYHFILLILICCADVFRRDYFLDQRILVVEI